MCQGKSRLPLSPPFRSSFSSFHTLSHAWFYFFCIEWSDWTARQSHRHASVAPQDSCGALARPHCRLRVVERLECCCYYIFFHFPRPLLVEILENLLEREIHGSFAVFPKVDHLRTYCTHPPHTPQVSEMALVVRQMVSICQYSRLVCELNSISIWPTFWPLSSLIRPQGHDYVDPLLARPRIYAGACARQRSFSPGSHCRVPRTGKRLYSESMSVSWYCTNLN